ncbi:hypothetical protein H632_c1007p0, partial [Helicosporidium sp. ATCC 50920]
MPEADGADLVRKLVCDELDRRRQEFEPFVTAEASFEVYLKLMRSYWTWGGEPELACAPDVLSLAVDVFAAGEERRLRLVNQYRPSSALLGGAEEQSQETAALATCTQRGAAEQKMAKQEPAGKASELFRVRLFFHEHGHYDLLVP